jgi:hypothetical protein
VFDYTKPEDLKSTSPLSRDLSQTDGIVSNNTSEERSALTLQLIEDGTLLQYFERDSVASLAHQETPLPTTTPQKGRDQVTTGGIVIING